MSWLMEETFLFFDKTLKNYMRTYRNIRKIAIGQGYDSETGCMLNYSYFKKYYKKIEQ